MSHGLTPGLASVTLRNLAVADVLKYARAAGLKAIEWVSDTHVPPGDLANAAEVKARCDDAGIVVAGYGSYWRAGEASRNTHPIETVVETAVALGAPTVRIWAGAKGSEGAYESYRSQVVDDARRAAKAAADAGLTASFEFQANTLNDTCDSALQLLDAVGNPALRTYWQPDYSVEFDDRIRALEMLVRQISNIHVFHSPGGQRAPLSRGRNDWRKYLQYLADRSGPHFVLLELVERDYPENLARDAAELHDILSEV